MSNNREIIARSIVDRFITAISGTDKKQIEYFNPEDRIYVGKLSPKSAEDSFSSSVLIKQISVDFRIPKSDVEEAIFRIYPQGNFFYRIIPGYEQQKKFFFSTFTETFHEATYASFEELLLAYKQEQLSEDMKNHKVQLLPIYEKVDIDRENCYFDVKVSEIYNKTYDCGAVPKEHNLYREIAAETEKLCAEIQSNPLTMPCQFRDKVAIKDLVSEDAWNRYIERQKRREEFDMFPRFDFSISVSLRGSGDCITATIALSNETPFGDETAGFGPDSAKKDNYRISTLFNSGIKVKCLNTNFVPIELDYFADDYKYDKNVFALGNNCNVEYDSELVEIQTTHVPVYIQKRLITNNSLVARFDDLIAEPIDTLAHIYQEMLREIQKWRRDYEARKNQLTPLGKRQFKAEIDGFDLEIKRFKTGIDLIQNHNSIRAAFCYMNMAFKQAAKGYDSWRLFQIVFVVSLILDVVAHEPELMLDEDIVRKAKTDDVDILYFPTGGGKTEAFLGIMVFNLFFDRIRGKFAGLTAILKYPLRLLSVQQVQRVSNILASAEQIRVAKGLGGDRFGLGYFVGRDNTPNKIDRNDKQTLSELPAEELDEKYRLLDVCPFCGKQSVHVVFDKDAQSLLHICSENGCASGGKLPLLMVDDDIYRFLPSVIISTVDKMTAIGFNSRFHNLLCGAEFKCPKHGYTDKTTCWIKDCECIPSDFERVRMKDPAPTLLIQDELHLIKESLGTYDAHYESLIEYFIKNLSGCNRGIKVIGATATISAYEQQAKHLYWKNAIRFPAASPYLDHNFYSRIDENDTCRIILGYAPFGKAIVNSVAYSLQYLKRVVWDLYQNPEQVLGFDGFHVDGSIQEQVQEVKKLLEDYWIILEYNNVKLESNRVLQALEDPINTELNSEGIQPLSAKKMTGDDSFQEVRATLSAIEHADSIVSDVDFNMIAATSMISHGVDADRFNLMMFYGMPGNTAEYIQAYSRVGRKHTGVVIDIMRPSREKDQSYLKNFYKFHEYKDILVDSVSINRWAAKAVETTLPGVISGLLLNYYLYQLKYTPEMNDISKFRGLKKAIQTGTISGDELKEHAYGVYKCSENDSSIGKLYKQTIDRMIDSLVDNLGSAGFEGKMYLTQVFDKCYFHVMMSLRDTDKQLLVEVK